VTLILVSPMKGWVAPLDEVPDAVFAERMLGDGVAIDPTGSTLHAPCDAHVVSIARTGHVVTLRADNGAEILIHIGIETVALDGEGFTAHVHACQRVKAGDLLIDFDLDLLARRAKSLIAPVLIVNSDAFTIAWRDQDRETDVGERFMELAALPVIRGHTDNSGAELRRSVTLGLPHGLHARPAARTAALAKTFMADMGLLAQGRRVNAKSPIALMTLGMAYGDEAVLFASGEEGAAALDALAAFLESDGGEEAMAPVEAPSLPVASPPVNGVFKGVSAAPGYAIGRIVQFRRADIRVTEEGAGADVERTALSRAIDTVAGSLVRSTDAGGVSGEILTAHRELLQDPELRAEAESLMSAGKSAAYAWTQALDRQAEALRRLTDPRLKERAGDLIDLKRLVLLALGGEAGGAMDLPPDTILLADDLLPSELMALGPCILGLCTARGGATSHVAIIAAALNIPAIAAAGPDVLAIGDGAAAILDAGAATLKVDPNTDELATARTVAARRRSLRAVAMRDAASLCRMADGTRIDVFANLAGVAEAASAVANGAEGCGLLRSEFLFMDRSAPPDEDEQHAAYQAIADSLAGRPLIVRTLDIGGDKPVAYLPIPREDNPALGLRGVRTSLWRPDLLRTQLRAILRVSPAGVCKIMVPMVSSVDELIAVRAIVDEERLSLGVEARLDLGVMIETPAAAVTAAALAAEADFLSIGTNDLTQYALAMDRTNPSMAAQADALHPAVLRLIALTCEGAQTRNCPVGVCGGLASEGLAAPLLIGLGVTELSVAPSVISDLKAAIRPLRLNDCRALAAEALRQGSATDVRALLTRTSTRIGEMETAP
jgi:phosphocarrier protein FPr/phosphocarrier protein